MTLSTQQYAIEESEILQDLTALVKRAQKLFRTSPEIGNSIEELQCLGDLVSKFCEWDGCDVLTVAISALNDSNYTHAAEKVQEVLDYEIATSEDQEQEYGYADQKNFD